MNHCSKCNNELVTGARFCNICGTPVSPALASPETPAVPISTPSTAPATPKPPVGTPVESATSSPETPAVPVAPTGLKRTINLDIRRVRPSREGKTRTDTLAPDASQVATPGTPDKSGESANGSAPELKGGTEQHQPASRQAHPLPAPVIPKTTIEFTSMKVGQAREKEKSALPDVTPEPTAQSTDENDVATILLPDSPAPTPVPDADSPEQVKEVVSSPSTAPSVPDETVPLPPPPALSPQEPDKTVPLPAPNAGASRVPGIIRPIVTSASLRQNTPIPRGQTPPNPMSPLPAVPNTPPVSGEKASQTGNARFSRPVNTPTPGSLTQDNQRRAESLQSGPVPPRQQSQPTISNNSSRQQTRFNAGAPQIPPLQPPQPPQTPRPSLHDMPTNYQQLKNGNGNGANSTANRQELPLFSPESFAYTSKAAQHWRTSWRDLQNAEAGPAEDVSKGQAEVHAPLANRKDSFLRLRAIRSKQKQDVGERNFGFWVTLFLMVCLIGGLAAYIVYSYLPNTSGAVRIAQPAGSQQPSFNVVGALSSSQTFTRGQSLRAHGDHFGANDPIHFLLDSTKPVFASNGSALIAQSDSQGSFDVTILVGKNWVIGAHIIAATDTRTKLSAFLDIQVNPDTTPITANNSTDLSFSLNGQPIDHLSFTAQIGQPSPPAQRITFTNISGLPMQWTASASTAQNLNWLTILDSEFAGQLDISQPHTIGISVNAAGLAKSKAPYKGQIVFTINSNTQLTLPVQLTIIDATPEMVFTPNPLVVTAKADGTCVSDTSATLTFINLGTTVINWSANPDRQDKIWFVDSSGKKNQQGILQPFGMDGDSAVVTLQCSGVKVGDKYNVNVYVNKTNTPFTEIVQIGG